MKIGSKLTRIVAHVRQSYALDYRSLAVFRILVALVVIADLVQRFGVSTVMYSDSGVLPRTLIIPIVGSDRWSFLFLQGSPGFAKLFIALGILAAALMLVGWRTRAATIVLWVVVVSLQARNTHMTYGADTLIRLSLFWGMFLPLGAMWSFDGNHSGRSATSRIASVAAFGLITQNALVYLFTALLKDGEKWRESFDAVYYALGTRDLSTWWGEWIFRNASDQIFTLMTVGTLWMEFTVPIMLLLPLKSDWLRMVAIALVLALHLGIGTTMSVGLFPAISIACILVVIPTGFWNYVATTRLSRTRIFSNQNTQASFDQSATDPGSELSPANWYGLGFIPSRYSDTNASSRVITNIACALAIAIGLMWNLTTVSSLTMPDPIRRTAVVTGLYQDWGMFAPNPRLVTVWFVLEGETTAGNKYDVFDPIYEDDFSIRQPVIWDQSNEVQLRNEPWRKYFWAIRSRENHARYLAGYACRNWNTENSEGDRLETVRLTVASAATLTNNQRDEPVYQHVGTWTCS